MKFSITIFFLVFSTNNNFIQGFIFGNSGGSNSGVSNSGCSCNPNPPCSPPPPCVPKQIPVCGSNSNTIQYVPYQPSSPYLQKVSSYASGPLSTYSSQPSMLPYASTQQPQLMPYFNQERAPMKTYHSQPSPSYSIPSKSFYSSSQSNYLTNTPQQEFVLSSQEKSYSQGSDTSSSYNQPSQEYKYRAKKKYVAGAKIHEN
ncbi:Hypothetical protein SRAE_2000411500 [Strongyloides ratti]|uniref:Uncharacterized protein n=1 Tax=Strongyloides ratti TaxID=34506 RepID=A0A090LI24_STRRB|nr:Hypothetical protein SRAE_2000411500 [Strongyloides ratti]CEF69466.1 Hypothetical protein SRAE_2000411500 [Strongyloides ratti]